MFFDQTYSYINIIIEISVNNVIHKFYCLKENKMLNYCIMFMYIIPIQLLLN